MGIGSDYENILFWTVVILFVLIVLSALWPPHRHRYDKLVGEQWDYEGHHWQCWQCACGKQKSKYFPLPDEESPHP